ncbi:MAG TPA: hypothetical protein VGR61_10940 [Candidatus Dormibacteraeota bacterium]|nr:hypothetical protein [Candidatus Dormibacteraeota bacterium]
MALLPVGPRPPDRIEHEQRLGPLPPLGQPVSQRFQAQEDGLSDVLVRFGTFGGVKRCNVRATLVDDHGVTLGSRVMACASVPDALLIDVVSVAPRPHSGGRWYTLKLEEVDFTNLLVAYGAQPERYLPAVGAVGTEPAALELRPRYHGHQRFYQVAADTMRRMGQYKPAWGRAPAMVGWLGLLALALVAVAAAPGRYRLGLLLVALALKGVIWSVGLPMLIVTDEEAHYSYVEYIAEEGRLPHLELSKSGDHYSPELLRATDRLATHVAPPSDRPDFGPGGTGPDEALLSSPASRHSTGYMATAAYAPVYYLPMVGGYALTSRMDFVSRIAVLRLWSVALGAVALILVAAIARRLFPGSPGSVLALVAAVGLQPMFSQQTAGINNDALAIPACFLCFLVALELAKPIRDRSTLPVLAGAALGFAIVAKPYGVAMAPVLVAGWLAGRWSAGELRPDLGAVRRFATAGIGGLAGLAATYGAWELVRRAVHGAAASSLLARGAVHPGLRSYARTLVAENFASLNFVWVRSFWGDFGWVNLELPLPLQLTLAGVTVAGATMVVAWLLFAALRLRRPPTAAATPRELSLTVATLLCVAVVASTFLTLELVAWVFYHQTGDSGFLQGRYGLMALPALFALPALCLRRFMPRLQLAAVLTVLALLVAGVHAVSVAVIVDRYYL